MGLGGILQELKTEGVLALYHDYRSGRLYDWSGNGNNGTATAAAVFTKQGIGSLPASAWVSVTDQVSTRLTVGTLIVLGDFVSDSNYEVLISKRDAGATNYQLGIQSTGAYFYDTSIRALGIISAGSNCVACNFANGVPPAFYYDGVYKGVAGSNCAVTAQNVPIYIGNTYSGVYPLKSNFKAALIISRVLTTTEHAKVYAQLENTTWETKGLTPGPMMP